MLAFEVQGCVSLALDALGAQLRHCMLGCAATMHALSCDLLAPGSRSTCLLAAGGEPGEVPAVAQDEAGGRAEAEDGEPPPPPRGPDRQGPATQRGADLCALLELCQPA